MGAPGTAITAEKYRCGRRADRAATGKKRDLRVFGRSHACRFIPSQ